MTQLSSGEPVYSHMMGPTARSSLCLHHLNSLPSNVPGITLISCIHCPLFGYFLQEHVFATEYEQEMLNEM